MKKKLGIILIFSCLTAMIFTGVVSANISVTNIDAVDEKTETDTSEIVRADINTDSKTVKAVRKTDETELSKSSVEDTDVASTSDETFEETTKFESSNIIYLTLDDNGSNVSFNVGDIVNLTLVDYGDGGYTWDITRLNQYVLRLDYRFNWGASGIPGDFGYDTWIFTANNSGTTILELACKRYWEDKPVMTFRVYIEVIDQNDNVSRGDVNGDGFVSIADVTYLVNYLFSGGPEPVDSDYSGDCNCDGAISIADVVYLINYLFKGGPEPGSYCG